jgi:hypothetical protein
MLNLVNCLEHPENPNQTIHLNDTSLLVDIFWLFFTIQGQTISVDTIEDMVLHR